VRERINSKQRNNRESMFGAHSVGERSPAPEAILGTVAGKKTTSGGKLGGGGGPEAANPHWIAGHSVRPPQPRARGGAAPAVGWVVGGKEGRETRGGDAANSRQGNSKELAGLGSSCGCGPTCKLSRHPGGLPDVRAMKRIQVFALVGEVTGKKKNQGCPWANPGPGAGAMGGGDVEAGPLGKTPLAAETRGPRRGLFDACARRSFLRYFLMCFFVFDPICPPRWEPSASGLFCVMTSGHLFYWSYRGPQFKGQN